MQPATGFRRELRVHGFFPGGGTHESEEDLAGDGRSVTGPLGGTAGGTADPHQDQGRDMDGSQVFDQGGGGGIPAGAGGWGLEVPPIWI